MRGHHVVFVVATCMTLSIGNARADDDAVTEEARNHFKAGVTLLQDPDGARIEEAYREFKTAYAVSPSPKMLGNLAYCAMKLERDAEAIAAYDLYLREAADIEAPERAQITADLMTLKSGLVHVTLIIEEPGGSVVDKRIPSRGQVITNAYGTLGGKVEMGLRNGHHRIEVKMGDVDLPPWTFETMPGASVTHTFVLPHAGPTPPPAGRSKVLPIVLTSLGGLALAGGAVTGVMALGRAQQTERNCPGGLCPVGYGLTSERDATYRLVHVTDGLLIGGGVVAATGLTWLVLSRGSSPPAQSAAALRPGAWCSAAGCAAAAGGSF